MPLVAFGSVDRSVLRWIRTGEDPTEFTLSSGEQPIARLVWPKAPATEVTCETSEVRWVVERGGFLSPHVRVRAAAGGPVLARTSLHVRDHSIEVAAGRRYRFHRTKDPQGHRVPLIPAWQVTTEDLQELVHLEPVRETRRLEGGAVLVSPAGVANPDLELILGLTWFFVAQLWFEDEALIPFEDLNESPNNPDVD